MKEKVLKVLWYLWLLFPMVLACFVLPFPCLGVLALIQGYIWDALFCFAPAVLAVCMYFFYRNVVRCGWLLALHGASWNAVTWLWGICILAEIYDALRPVPPVWESQAVRLLFCCAVILFLASVQILVFQIYSVIQKRAAY